MSVQQDRANEDLESLQALSAEIGSLDPGERLKLCGHLTKAIEGERRKESDNTLKAQLPTRVSELSIETLAQLVREFIGARE